MSKQRVFHISEVEVRKTRRAPLLPVLLILPMAAMFGFDSSKSQPLHFLMVFSIAILFSAAVVSIGLHGARRQIAEYRKSRLVLSDSSLVWETGGGRTELALNRISRVAAARSRGHVRRIDLHLVDGTQKQLEAYEDMEALYDMLARNDR